MYISRYLNFFNTNCKPCFCGCFQMLYGGYKLHAVTLRPARRAMQETSCGVFGLFFVLLHLDEIGMPFSRRTSIALQKAAFWLPICRVSEPERPSFRAQKVSF